jgi:ABC-type dipeptide/oligopeptide/nickel transport system permease subunit
MIPPSDPERQNIEQQTHFPETSEDDIEQVENAIELKEVAGISQSRLVLRRFVRHKAAMISLVVFTIVVLVSFTSIGIDAAGIKTPGWWPFNSISFYPLEDGGRPSVTHPFGQDELGHDTFAQVMRGTQQSLMIVFVSGLLATFLGVLVGSLAGFFRGATDQLLMRFTDAIIIIPVLVITAVLGKTFGRSGSFVLALVLGLVLWTGMSRLVRGDVLSLREREYVDAARVAGAGNARIIFRHILPNAIGVIIVNATLVMSAVILTEAAVSFLGFGVQFPDVSLGKLIHDFQTAFNTRPWLFWWPGLMIVVIALTINFIGDGLRDAFDPRQKRGMNRAARKQRHSEQAVEGARS